MTPAHRHDRDDATWRTLVVLTLAVSGLHLVRIGSHSYWFDELFSVGGASQASFAEALAFWYPVDLTNPPLYHLLLWAYARLVGPGETAMRLLSWGAVTATSLYLLGSAVVGDRLRRGMAALLVAVLPASFYYAQEARAYALLLLCAAVTQVGYLRFTREGRISWGFAVGVIVSSWIHYFGLFYGGTLLALAWLRFVRQRAFGQAVLCVLIGVASVVWLVYVLVVGRGATVTQPFWVTWTPGTPVQVLMHITSPTLALLMGAAWLRYPAGASREALWRVSMPVLVFWGLIAAISTYRFLILGRYFYVLVPAVAILGADLIAAHWDAVRRLRPSLRLSALALVGLLLAAENVAWMSRQKWGPFQNYRGVAEYIIQDVRQSGSRPAVVSIVAPFPNDAVRRLERYYLDRLVDAGAPLTIQVVGLDEIERVAPSSQYVVAMHSTGNVSAVRSLVERSDCLEEIAIPTTHRSMTLLAKERCASDGQGLNARLTVRDGDRPYRIAVALAESFVAISR